MVFTQWILKMSVNGYGCKSLVFMHTDLPEPDNLLVSVDGVSLPV